MSLKKIQVVVLFLLSLSATETCWAQMKDIKGMVIDAFGIPIAGATISVKNSDRKTVSAPDGTFLISAAKGEILVATFVGMTDFEMLVTELSSITIALQPVSKSLSDIVVVGYGTQRRKSITGAISKVSSEEINALPVVDARQALQGRVPGLTVVNNGSPGVSPIIRIRGIGSINYASDPLYVIDGLPAGNIGILDGRDIESIDVLRDASAAAIYGSRAANGVITVTTKKGSRDGTLKVGIESYLGWQEPWKQLDLLNTQQYLVYGTDLLTNAGSELPDRFSNMDEPVYEGADKTYNETNTDWQKAMFRSAPMYQTNVSLSGGGDKSRFYASAGYIKQDGIMIGTNYDRYNFRINSDHLISNSISFGENLAIISSNILNENYSGGRTQLKHIIHSIPYLPIEDPTLLGGYRGPDGSDGSDAQNPVRIALQDLSRNSSLNIQGSVFAEVKLPLDLKYRFTAGVYSENLINRTNFPAYNESFNARAANIVNQSQSNFRSIYLSNQLNFEKRIKAHFINITAVAEKQDNRGRFLFGSGTSTNNTLQELSNSLQSRIANGGLSDELLYSFVGRVNYEYDSKYLLSASMRRDGSSVFAPGNQWASFPSISAGWRISEESFLSNSKTISELKLRGSWGVMGFNGIGNYAWQPVLKQNTAPILGDERQPAAFFNSLGNSDLKWEKTEMINIGTDVGLWNNRLVVSAEYYIRKTRDLILATPLAPSLGFTQSAPANVGSMENKGFEFEVTYAKKEGAFNWEISGNFSTVTNRVLSFGPKITSPIFAGYNPDYGGFDITRTAPGEAVQSFYGWKVDGIFQSQQEINEYNGKDGDVSTPYQETAAPGDIRFKDLNGDGTITSEDRTVLGSFIPDFTYGINFGAYYKNFDLTVFLQGVQGNEIYNGTKVLTQGMLRLFGAGTEVTDAWTPDNTDTNIPRAVSGDPNNNTRTSDRFLEDGSYLRVKLLSLGYSVPSHTLSNIFKGTLSNVRFYVSTQNLITITKYTGYDPEIGSLFNNALTSGIDYGQFPQARTYLVGLQVDF